jgi:PAS domain S-box-containing protein
MKTIGDKGRQTGDQHEAMLYRLLVKDLQDYAIFQIDLDHRMVSWNVGVERNLGYTEQEFLGLSFAQIFTDEDISAGVPEQELTEAARTGHREDTRWHRRKDGSLFFVSGMVTALYDQGELIGFSKVMRDQTGRKREQQALQRSHLELSEFAAVVAHDLRTPLRTVHAYIELLMRHLEGRLETEERDLAASILQGAKSMEHLIDSLLDYARAETVILTRELVDLAAVIDSAWKGLHALVQETKAQLRCDDLPVVQGNSLQLKQVFQNLLENALKYSGPQPPEIEIRAVAQKHNWLICVKDNGPGFDPRYAAYIFEPLKRLQTDQDGGCGIGLAICKKIVRRLGGEIWAESNPGKGAAFYFKLRR